jgi:demethylmenaquinone methyltransferase/2-methoxy-6-polyprenyl-1,4-benzoquinol methylase
MSAASDLEMLTYYEERASEYDEVYLGKGPAMPGYTRQYTNDVAHISRLVAGFGSGHLIDIACGPGFWAPHYARNAERITFLDQSEKVLAECQKRLAALPLSAALHFLRGNFFTIPLEPSACDCALAGFLLSHLTRDQEECFFGRLKEILKPQAELMLIDSLWNEERRKHRNKEGLEERVLNDGRRFKVYKRYLAEAEFRELLEQRRFSLRQLYAGDVFIAARAKRVDSECG